MEHNTNTLTIDLGSSDTPSMSRNEYLTILSKWLYLEDTQAIDIIMATAISISLPGDPVWLFLIGPAGSSKTELLRSLKGEHIHSISSLTPQTFISGLKGIQNADLLPKLDGKLLIIKDFTSILSKKGEDQAAIFADLREAYDGYLEKSYGSGVGTKGFQSKFGIIAAVTDAIDKYHIVHSQLGERFLKCRLRTNPKAAIDRASDLAGQEEEMRRELSTATKSVFNCYSNQAKELVLVEVEETIQERIKALADVTAKLRSEVPRDRLHKVLYHPQAEVGTRINKQLLKLGQSLAIFYENASVGEDEYGALLRIAKDSIPRQRTQLVEGLYNAEPMNTKEAGDIANIPTDTAKELLEDLWMLELVDRSGDHVFEWQLAEETSALLLESGLGTQNTLGKHEN
ncbi:MAG: hypothetical protein AMJ70_03835 [Dehalococcoidia bacterium SG8_51_3]|nr:MAG: hypothetical protein AMJ70_03835 [Dehalococcoidia bacterium SG8_51_3]